MVPASRPGLSWMIRGSVLSDLCAPGGLKPSLYMALQPAQGGAGLSCGTAAALTNSIPKFRALGWPDSILGVGLGNLSLSGGHRGT